MKIFDEQQSFDIRNKFVNCFINKNTDYYANNINSLQTFKDGECYMGYLWDCFNQFEQKNESICMCSLKKVDEFYLMWDIHSCERIFVPNHWSYPKKSVILLSYDEYVDLSKTFPEDIYLFDKTFSWCCALTHEEDEDGKRYCLFASCNTEYSSTCR